MTPKKTSNKIQNVRLFNKKVTILPGFLSTTGLWGGDRSLAGTGTGTWYLVGENCPRAGWYPFRKRGPQNTTLLLLTGREVGDKKHART